MSDDIMEFLRRAAQQQQRQQRREMEVVDADVIEDAEIISDDEVSGDDVARHVQQHIGSASFEDEVSRLGAGIEQSDEAMESRLQQTFEHRLGDLGGRTPSPSESTLDDDRPEHARAASVTGEAEHGLRTWLRDPDQLRKAIVLNELLRRPEERWS